MTRAAPAQLPPRQMWRAWRGVRVPTPLCRGHALLAVLSEYAGVCSVVETLLRPLWCPLQTTGARCPVRLSLDHLCLPLSPSS